MTRDDALDLAKRVKRSWRTHQTLDEWVGYLLPFDDPTTAGRALDRLREVEPLAFRDFGAKYRALAATTSMSSNVVELPARRLSRDERVAILTRNGAKENIAAGQHKQPVRSESSRFTPEEIAAMWDEHNARLAAAGAPRHMTTRQQGDSL